jgi:hypothetical protein
MTQIRLSNRQTVSDPLGRITGYPDNLCAGLASLAVESSELVREVHDMAGRLLVSPPL